MVFWKKPYLGPKYLFPSGAMLCYYIIIYVKQIAEVCLSLFVCAEVSYYGYLYAKIDNKEYYQIATGYTKAGVLSGTFVSGILGQLVIYLNNGDYSTLPYYSLAGIVLKYICNFSAGQFICYLYVHFRIRKNWWRFNFCFRSKSF